MKVLRISETKAAARLALAQKFSATVAAVMAEMGEHAVEATCRDIAEYAARNPDKVRPGELAAMVMVAFSIEHPEMTEQAGTFQPAFDTLAQLFRDVALGVVEGTVRSMIQQIEATQALCPHCEGPIDFAGIREMLVMRLAPEGSKGNGNGNG